MTEEIELLGVCVKCKYICPRQNNLLQREEFLRLFLRRHFAGKPVVASRNVSSFLRLKWKLLNNFHWRSHLHTWKFDPGSVEINIIKTFVSADTSNWCLLLLIFKQNQPNKQANLLRISYNLLYSFICAAGTMRFCHRARAKHLKKKRKNVI